LKNEHKNLIGEFDEYIKKNILTFVEALVKFNENFKEKVVKET
jgi:hypothetical protein